MNDNCTFCKIISGQITAEKVFENEAILAFKDIKPSAPVHVLVVPKQHLADLSQSQHQTEVLGKLQAAIPTIAGQVGLGSDYKVSLNAGKFQEVPHLHYHLLGGWERGDD